MNKEKAKDLRSAQNLFEFFKYDTDCLNAKGELTVVPRYIVAIGDDPISAYYACKIAKQAERQMGLMPTILCCGGYYPFSKHLNARGHNGRIRTEGRKMAKICEKLCPDFRIVMLDKSAGVVQSIIELAQYLKQKKDEDKQIIFCPTQRLSKRLERVVSFSAWLTGVALKAHYYVPKENLDEVLCKYNGMKFADGTLYMNEAAVLYNRLTSRYHTGRFLDGMDINIPKHIHEIGNELCDKYPLLCYNSKAANFRQWLRLVSACYLHRSEIERDLQQHEQKWQAEFV